MNKEQLRELVKAHFNLVDHTPTATEEKFGEIFDENKAFKIVFPGDVLKVGDEVKVVTTEGQESLAPDGYHKLIDGTVIKTEGSSVVEIESPEGKSEEEMSEMDGLGAFEDKANKAVEEVFGADPSISQVEGTTAQNSVTDVNPDPEAKVKTEAEVEAEMMKKVKMAIDETIASEIAGIKEEMGKMKQMYEELAKAPASGKTMAAAGKVKMEAFSTATNDTALKVARELIKRKNK